MGEVVRFLLFLGILSGGISKFSATGGTTTLRPLAPFHPGLSGGGMLFSDLFSFILRTRSPNETWRLPAVTVVTDPNASGLDPEATNSAGLTGRVRAVVVVSILREFHLGFELCRLPPSRASFLFARKLAAVAPAWVLGASLLNTGMLLPTGFCLCANWLEDHSETGGVGISSIGEMFGLLAVS